MAKKAKVPVTKNNRNPVSDSASGSSGILKNLFGDFSPENAYVSIFSENNPFRRKPNDNNQTPQQWDLESGSAEAIEKHSNGNLEEIDDVEVKNGKRKKEKGKSFDSGSIEEASETPLETKKKSKKGKLKNNDLGFVSNGPLKEENEKNPNLDFATEKFSKKDTVGSPNLIAESNGVSEKDEGKYLDMGIEKKDGDNKRKEKKKKRKRDELEREYEARLYGVEEEQEGGEGGLVKKVVGEKRKMVDNPAEMLISNEGFDDESKLLKTVFVGNLPLKVKKKALLKEFSQFGGIESVRIRSVPIVNSKTPRKGAIMKKQINDSVDSVHAYIVFKTEETAQAALAHNMAVIGGNHIRVDRACPPRKKLKGESAPLYDNTRTVFVGNLPFDVKDEELYQLFCSINQLEKSVEAIRVIRDPHNSVGKGIAYVLFKTKDAANLVVKRRNLKLRDRDLRLYRAKADSTPSKRKNPPHPQTVNSPAKKLAGDSRTPSHSDSRMKPKSSIASYQGLQANKSGVEKKIRPKSAVPMKVKSQNQKGGKPNASKTKRPAVAARKAALQSGSASKQAGKKRKVEHWTPESSRRNKKAKKFR